MCVRCARNCRRDRRGAGAGATTDNGALPGGGAGGAAAAAAGAHTYVWGTNIDIASISRRLRRFLTGKSFFFFFF